MKARKIVIPFLGITATIILVGMFLLLGPSGSDEARYRQCVRTKLLVGGLYRTCPRIPAFLAKPVHYVGVKLWDRATNQEYSLFHSGYLTNVSITLLKASAYSSGSVAEPTIDEISRRVHEAVPDNSWVPCSLAFSNKLVWVDISCRTQDVAPIQKALSSY